MALSVEHLPHEHEDPSSILGTHIKKLGVEVSCCNLNTTEAEAGGSPDLLASQPSLLGELWASERHRL